jgi:hypothetical protein
MFSSTDQCYNSYVPISTQNVWTWRYSLTDTSLETHFSLKAMPKSSQYPTNAYAIGGYLFKHYSPPARATLVQQSFIFSEHSTEYVRHCGFWHHHHRLLMAQCLLPLTIAIHAHSPAEGEKRLPALSLTEAQGTLSATVRLYSFTSTDNG